MKEYFVKASWLDASQPLIRQHRNVKVYLDLSQDEWDIQKLIMESLIGKYTHDIREFCIDFMICCEP